MRETEQSRVAGELNAAITEVELALRRAGLLTRGVWAMPDLGGVLAWSKIQHPTGGVDEWLLVWEHGGGEFRTPLVGCLLGVKTFAVREGLPNLIRRLVGNRDRQIPAMRAAIDVARELRSQIDALPPADPAGSR